MRGCKYWRQAIRLSVLMHCFLIAGIGFLSPLSPVSSNENEYIEMELGDYSPSVSAEMIADITKKQLSSSRVAQESFANNTQKEGLITNGVILGNEGEQASTGASVNSAADYSVGSSGPIFAEGKQSVSGTPIPSSNERPTIQPPRILQRTEPVYPDEARRQGLEGKVVIKLEVLPTGRVGNINIERSSGSEFLDNAAVEAVRNWRFSPARDTASGSSIRCITTVPIIFRLN